MRKSVIAAAIVAIIIIGVFSSSFYYLHKDEKNLVIGPKLILSTITSSENVTGNETVQVFSEMPSIIGEFTSNFGNGIDIGNKNIYNNSASVSYTHLTLPTNREV